MRSCWTTVVDPEDGRVQEISQASLCVGSYLKGKKVKGLEYTYELHNYENKKIGERKGILLHREEDCK